MGAYRTITPLAAATLAVGLAAPAGALEIKSSDVHAMGYPTTEAIAYMGDLLSQWTNGRLTIKIFHSMQLGGEKEALEQVQLGALEMTRVSVGVVGPIVDEFNAFNLPYLFENVEHMHRVVDGEIGQALLNKLEAGGLIGLGYMDAGSRSFYNNKHPIEIGGRSARAEDPGDAEPDLRRHGDRDGRPTASRSPSTSSTPRCRPGWSTAPRTIRRATPPRTTSRSPNTIRWMST